MKSLIDVVLSQATSLREMRGDQPPVLLDFRFERISVERKLRMIEKAHRRFEDIAVRWRDDAYQTKPSQVPEHLYHYTDAQGLVGMLSGGKIWATDHRFLNDKSEVGHTRSKCRSLIVDRMAGDVGDLQKSFYSKIIAWQDKGVSGNIFVFSLSEEQDDLSQWRGYAREGQGFTIGFCGRSLYRAAAKADCEYSFFRIEYDHAVQIAAIETALTELEAELEQLAKEANADTEKLCESAARWFDWLANSRSVACKHKSFSAEREWRIMTVIPAEDGASEIRVRASGNRLVNYCELSLPDPASTKLPIKRIGIGPGFVSSEDVHAVRSLCKRYGYELDIYPADTPYRRV